MNFLVISPTVESPKARGIHRMLFNLLSTLRERDHTIFLLTGLDHGQKTKVNYKELEDKVIKSYLRYYFVLGRCVMKARKPLDLCFNILRELISPYNLVTNDNNLKTPEIKLLNFVDYIIQKPYILQIIEKNLTLIANYHLNRIVKKYNIDIVLTGEPLNLKLSRNNRKKGVKLVQTIHDFLPLEGTYLAANSHLIEFAKRISAAIRNSDHIIANSQDTKSKILNLRKDVPISILYSFPQFISSNSTLSISDELILNKFHVKKGDYLLYLSAIELRKNVDGLIKAYGLASRLIKSKLLIVGERGFGYEIILDEYNRLDRKTRKRIKFFDYVSDREKLILMKYSKAFIWPSKNEGLGLPVMEAMHLEVPIVASKLPSHVEIAGDSPHYINDPFDVEEIAQRLMEIDSDEKLRESIVNKYRPYNELWTKEKYKERVKDFVLELEEDKNPIYIFTHLAKTGGTTFVGNLYKHFEFDKEFVDLGPQGNRFRMENGRKNIEERSRRELNAIKILAGHLTEWNNQFMFKDRPARFIIFLREPVARVISHYTFDTSEEKNYQTFAEWYSKWTKNQMFYYLCDHLNVSNVEEILDRLKRFWHIGFTEELDTSLKYIYKKLGIPSDYVNRRVAGEKSNSTHDLLGYDDPTKIIKPKYKPTKKELITIKKDHELDIWLYNHIRSNTINFNYVPTKIEIPEIFKSYKFIK